MACRRGKRTIHQTGRQTRQQTGQQNGQKNKEAKPADTAKAQTPLRRSQRLNPTTSKDPLPSNKVLAPLPAPTSQNRKRPREDEDLFRQRQKPARLHAIEYWSQYSEWPRDYLELGNTTRTYEDSMETSNQKSRAEKSAPYRNPRFVALLASKGNYMKGSKLGITDASKDICRDVLENKLPLSKDTLFDDDVAFCKFSERLMGKNEARVIQDVSRRLVPSVETLYSGGANSLEFLVESVNERWTNCIPLFKSPPQPDYAVGFSRDTFSAKELEKLSPLIGDYLYSEPSHVMATHYMYFPFLTCEVKCGTAAFDLANRQNAHSMSLAVGAIVALFRHAKRESEINREIVAFSVSHNDNQVMLYGHYAVINGSETSIWRHDIHSFDFTALNGKERWTTARFTRYIYMTWMPNHLARIRSAIHDLPADYKPESVILSQGT